LLKFDRREGFHQPPLTYDTQITVCPVCFFYPAKMSSLGFYFNSLNYFPECGALTRARKESQNKISEA
jgi:hypothetical protein